MTAPVASGWGYNRRMVFAPTEKRRLNTAHANYRPTRATSGGQLCSTFGRSPSYNLYLFYQVTFRKKLYGNLDELQYDLDE